MANTMECNKRMIHNSTMKPAMSMQMTLDDDKNVPDSKPDIEKIVTSRGEIEITEVESLTNKIKVYGLCHFYLLYTTDIPEHPVNALEGTLPFEQMLNCDGIVPKTQVKIKTNLEDLSISIINSRKINVRSLITLRAFMNDITQLEAATDISCPPQDKVSELTNPGMECLYQKLDLTTLLLNKKDVYRVKERLSIPKGKPSIYEILWSNSSLKNFETKLGDGIINLSGDLSIFMLYKTDDEMMSLQHMEMELPFHGEIACEECSESMMECIEAHIGNVQYTLLSTFEAEDTSNNQMRDSISEDSQQGFEIECTLDLDIRIYQDEEITLLSDVYSPNAECELQQKPFSYTKLLQKNYAKTRITQRMKLTDAKDRILQICHIDGSVKVDDMTVVKDGVDVEGVVAADLLFLTNSDLTPLGSTYLLVPFHYLVELEGIQPEDTYEITTALEQISINMVDENEVEIKANIALSAIAFRKQEIQIIEDISISCLDSNKMQTQPGMIGYIVKHGDTLWNVAKTYYTTTAQIKSCNELESDQLTVGQKLIIVK